ncbi:late secretory pathway protein avl9 [Irineochytrium annulatum]|nr:late secretory pathway protein avl9 [Irineochytrium annulatum]
MENTDDYSVVSDALGASQPILAVSITAEPTEFVPPQPSPTTPPIATAAHLSPSSTPQPVIDRPSSPRDHEDREGDVLPRRQSILVDLLNMDDDREPEEIARESASRAQDGSGNGARSSVAQQEGGAVEPPFIPIGSPTASMELASGKTGAGACEGGAAAVDGAGVSAERRESGGDSGRTSGSSSGGHGKAGGPDVSVEMFVDEEKAPLIMHVLCVAFHHRNGPQVEYAYPSFPGMVAAHDKTEPDGSRPAVELPEEWSFLVDFHLPPVKQWTEEHDYHPSTLFGLACFRQIAADDLLIKTADMTRSSVQKAVVILAKEPILGSVKTKLGLVTQAFFGQRDFSRVDILQNLFESLHASTFGPVPDSNLYTGISLRELLHKFKFKALQLFKLLLLEKKILFFGQKVERLSSYQYSLISLIPDLLRNIADVGSPALSHHQPSIAFHGYPANTPAKERMRTFGLPLRVFGEGAFFQPYIPLQQIDVLMAPETTSFLVGTSNAIFTHHKGFGIDAVVNVDAGTIDFTDPALASALALTGSDRRFIDELVKSVVNTWSKDGKLPDNETGTKILTEDYADDPYLNQQMEFEGSDDDIRSRMEAYLFSLLASVKYTNNPIEVNSTSPGGDVAVIALKQRDVLTDFGMPWVKLWQQTNSYKHWNETTTIDILDKCNPGHPKEGTSVMSIFSSKLSNIMTSSSSSSAATPAPTPATATTMLAPTISTTAASSASTSATAVPGARDIPAGPGGADDKSYQVSKSLPSASVFTSMSGWITQRKREWSTSSATPRVLSQELDGTTGEHGVGGVSQGNLTGTAIGEERLGGSTSFGSLNLHDEKFVKIDL